LEKLNEGQTLACGEFMIARQLGDKIEGGLDAIRGMDGVNLLSFAIISFPH